MKKYLIKLLFLFFSIALLSSNKDPSDLLSSDNLQTENRLSFDEFSSNVSESSIDIQATDIEKVKNVLENFMNSLSDQQISLNQSQIQSEQGSKIKINSIQFLPKIESFVIQKVTVASPEMEPIQIESSRASAIENISTHSVTIASVPLMPSLSSPYNGSNTGGTEVTLLWNTVSNATDYYLQMAGDSSFSNPYISTSVGNSYGVNVPGFLDNGGIFYWRVRAGNSDGWSSYSSTWYFINGPSSTPAIPSLSTPSNGANVAGQQVSLQWYPSNRANNYQLQLSLDNSFNDPVFDEALGNSNGVQFSSFPDNGSIFYWRVRAGNSLGWSSWSSTSSFINGPSGVPEVPYLQMPYDNSYEYGDEIRFEWYPAERASKYYLQVAYDNSFNQFVFNGEVGNSIGLYLSPFPDNGTTFYWRVRAGNSLGWGSWTSTWTFVNTPSAIPEYPVLTTPGFGINQPGTSVSLDWEHADRSMKYEVQIALDRYFDEDSIITEQELDYRYRPTFNLLDNGMDIYWRVRAGNSLGWSVWSPYSFFINGPSASPGVPNLTQPADGVLITAGEVIFRWDSAPRGYSYWFQLATDPYFGDIVYNIEEDLIIGLRLSGFPDDGTTYYWRVQAINDLGWGAWSNVRHFTYGTPKISAPTGLTATAGPFDGEITIKWTQNSEPDLDYYNIYVGTQSGIYNNTYRYISPSLNQGCTLYNFNIGTRYYFVITAVNDNGYESVYSNQVSVVAQAFNSSTPPTIPGNLTVTSIDYGTALQLNWNPSTDDEGVYSYMIFRKTNSSSVSETNYDSGFPIEIYDTEYDDYWVQDGNTYYYRVLAVDYLGNRSGFSNLAYCAAGDILSPMAPSGISINSGINYVDISWIAPSKNIDGTWCTDLAGFNIYRSNISGYYGSSPLNGNQLLYGSSYSDTNVQEGVSYYYIIKAVDDNGNESPPSQEAVVTVNILDDPPEAPRNMTLIQKTSELEIKWDANQESDLAGYNIYRAETSSAYTSQQLNSVLLTAVKFIDTNIDPTKTYFYIVRSVDNLGQESENSNEVSGKVGEGALWIITPNSETKAVLDFGATDNPMVKIDYHLDSGYLSLYLGGIKTVLEIINSETNQIVYSGTRSNPRGSSGTYNPYFIWNGLNMDRERVVAGNYHIKISLHALLADDEWVFQLYDQEQNAIEVIQGVTPPSYTSLDCDISFPDNHWIPNNGETVMLNNIEIWGKDAGGNKVVITDDYQDIKFLAPLDPNWRATNDGSNNIYTNKGTCTYELCALINNEMRTLIKFHMKTAPTDNQAFEITEYCTPYFTAEGIANEDNQYFFRVEDIDGKRILHFRGPNNYSTTSLYLRAVTAVGVTIRPGDDMLFRFTLADFEQNITSPATASNGEFIAVYDKKMVWRANLYIDEGNGDWNNENEWDDAVDNEWYVSQANGADEDGGQISINSWTRYYQAGTSFAYANNDISDCVAYTSGGSDSVTEFNLELNNQMNCLNISRADGWNVTTAPNSNWSNYDDQQRQSNGNTFYPYRPNYSAWLLYGTDTWVNNDGDTVAAYWESPIRFVKESSGVDCSGFLQRCASYNGNLFRLTDLVSEDTWTNGGNASSLEGTGGVGGDSWFIASNTNMANASVIVPGDIIYMNGHVGIVHNVQYAANSRTVTPDNVSIIESCGDGWRVRRHRTWQSFVTMQGINDLQIKRLIVN